MVNTTENLRDMNNDNYISEFIVQAPVGILTFSVDWKINFVNEVFVKYAILYQFEHSSLKGINILDSNIFPGIDLKEDLLELENGLSFEKEVKNISTLDKGRISVIVKGSPLFENNKFSGGILIVEDLKISSSEHSKDELHTDQISDVLSRINDLVFITDNSGKIKYSFGKSVEKLKTPVFGLNDLQVNKLFGLETDEKIQKGLEAAAANKKPEKINTLIKLNEEELTFECRIVPLLNWRKQVQFLFFFFNDISDFVNERNILESEIGELKQYQLITDAVSDAIFALQSTGEIIFWNKASELLFGYARSEVYGKFFGKAFDVFDLEYFEGIKKRLEKSKIWKISLTVYKKDGKKEIIEAKFSHANNNSGMIVVVCSNITERATTEQLVKASEEKFKSIVSLASDLICNLDPEGKIIFANKAFINAFKYSENEILTKSIKDIFTGKEISEHDFTLKQYEKPGIHEFEIEGITKNGDTIFLNAIISPSFQNNNLSYFNLILTDHTKKQLTQKNLMIFLSMFNAFLDGVAAECEGKLILANEAFAKIFGYDNSKVMLDKDLFDLVAVNDIPKVAGYFQLIGKNKEIPERFEFLAKRKDGSNFFAETSLSAFESDKKIYVVMVARDITERKRTQQAIRESEEKYRNLTENIDDFLYTFEKTGSVLRPVFYTSSVEKITGYNQTDFLADSRLIFKLIHPDDFLSLKKKLSSLLKSKIQLSGEFEFRIINRHGNVVWIRNKLNIVRDNEGKIQKIYGLVSDISLRKNAEDELKRSTDNLVKLNETKDRFISIISHDLRTPFSSILGFTDLLLSDSDLTEVEKKQYIEFIKESSKSMLSLVNSLLDWTRLQTGRIRFEPEKIEAYKIIDSSLNALSGVAFQKKIEIISDISKDIVIFIDKDLMLQVFNNLISNAIKFTPQHGTITISVKPSERMRFIEFSIKDTGIGIKPDDIKKLFKVDTKFTSEGTEGEKGTGLGLSLVKEIIDKHGGKVWVESELGKGSEFKFTLPTASANILLVDDSKTDKLLYSKILKNITPDYNVDIASDGKEAIEKILVSPPALVITDHLMPRMNGYNLVLEIKKAEIKGKPPVMILSGDLDREIVDEYHELGVEFVFQKPVNLNSFKQAVEKSLKKGIMGRV
jgi:PAS domain S-box-containing protein